MNIANALLIEGWMDPPNLEWLAIRASKHHRIVEVGCWMGRSTMVLADNTDGVVIAVDTWLGNEEHQGFMQGKSINFVYDIFCKNLKVHINSGKVRPMRLRSVDAAYALRDQTFDMVFVDAAHDYENVKADILSWKPLVKGLLCGHDAGHPPIAQAVRELLPGAAEEIGTWWVEL